MCPRSVCRLAVECRRFRAAPTIQPSAEKCSMRGECGAAVPRSAHGGPPLRIPRREVQASGRATTRLLAVEYSPFVDAELAWIVESTGAKGIRRTEKLQSLWSGYGELFRLHLREAPMPSVV